MARPTEPCLAKIGKEWKKAEFMGVFQSAGTNLLFGHPSAGPVVVVRCNGRLYKLETNSIDFEVTK